MTDDPNPSTPRPAWHCQAEPRQAGPGRASPCLSAPGRASPRLAQPRRASPRPAMPGTAKPSHPSPGPTPAIAYLRTSSAANVGPDRDSDKRQRAAIEAFAEANNYQIVGEEYDAAISGSDPVNERPGFIRALERIKSNGVKTIIVESPDRFARDLTVQLLGHDMLKREGIVLIAASAPTHFIEDTPTAVMVRQILGAVAQFEKASLVAKLRAARERKRKAGGRAHGRRATGEINPDAAIAAHELAPGLSLRRKTIALAERGFTSESGRPLHLNVVKRLIAEGRRLSAKT